MIFNSISYAFFLALIFGGYYVLPEKIRYIWLLLASYYFYMQANTTYALLLLGVTIVTYAGSLAVERIKRKRIAKYVLGVEILSCLGLLVYYKYIDFIIYNLNRFISMLGTEKISAIDIILPMGISFFVFQAVGYAIDVYRGDTYAEKNPLKYALFLSFFPQLVAGPIERSKNLLKQLSDVQPIDGENIRVGLVYILYGLWQKVLIADNIAHIIDPMFADPAKFSGIQLMCATFLFAIQIYCDFGGYSNIAIGSAKLFGINLMRNFNAPYMALNVTDFWRRWHISLTTWFRDYLYIPLGGNRKGKIRKYINIMTVFFVSGLWHGASWGYVSWGVINGFYIVAENILGISSKNKPASPLSEEYAIVRRWLQRLATFVLISFTWLFFRAGSLSNGVNILHHCITHIGITSFITGDFLKAFGSTHIILIIMISLLIMLFIGVLNERGYSGIKFIFCMPEWLRWCIYLTGIAMIILHGAYGDGYEQKQFIYFQF